MLVWVYRYSSYVVVFFFKQKTAYEMRISDWSSDVCSSDLADRRPYRLDALVEQGRDEQHLRRPFRMARPHQVQRGAVIGLGQPCRLQQVAVDRKSGV